MRGVVQRVTEAAVTVDGNVVGSVGKGLMVLVGIGEDDGEADIAYLTYKILNLRIFDDENGKTNLSLGDLKSRGVDCGVLLISQFTLMGDARHGKRPNFSAAGSPEHARILYEKFQEAFSAAASLQGIDTAYGVFQAEMMVSLVNDGPFTILLDSKKTF